MFLTHVELTALKKEKKSPLGLLFVIKRKSMYIRKRDRIPPFVCEKKGCAKASLNETPLPMPKRGRMQGGVQSMKKVVSYQEGARKKKRGLKGTSFK